MQKSKLPVHVQGVRAYLADDQNHRCFKIAKKLIGEDPERISMWKSLERRRVGDDEVWVWAFLHDALNASSLPKFHYLSQIERKELAEQIERISKKLSLLLKRNDLDFHLIYNDGKIFNGFFCFEDFGESNRESIDAEGRKKLLTSRLLMEIAGRSNKLIAEEPSKGKASKNMRAVRFIRLMAERNLMLYGTPLNNVIAHAANSIFNANYVESDIRKLLSR
jgi:hypothetical protein